MNWENFLGKELYTKMKEYLSSRKMTIAGFVRMTVERFFERG